MEIYARSGRKLKSLDVAIARRVQNLLLLRTGRPKNQYLHIRGYEQKSKNNIKRQREHCSTHE
jgi:hypothetical protein